MHSRQAGGERIRDRPLLGELRRVGSSIRLQTDALRLNPSSSQRSFRS
jgi:hypothetical protein